MFALSPPKWGGIRTTVRSSMWWTSTFRDQLCSMALAAYHRRVSSPSSSSSRARWSYQGNCASTSCTNAASGQASPEGPHVFEIPERTVRSMAPTAGWAWIGVSVPDQGFWCPYDLRACGITPSDTFTLFEGWFCHFTAEHAEITATLRAVPCALSRSAYATPGSEMDQKEGARSELRDELPGQRWNKGL